MSTWKILPSTQVLGRTYSRPLDGNETSFYWDRVFNGTADVVWHYTVQVKGPRGKDLFHQNHVRRAWISLKQRHPLLGSRLELRDGTDVVNCIVSEKRLAQLFPGEVIFCDISSAEEVSRLVERTMLKPPVLLAHLPARIIILRLADEPSIFHVLFHVTHLITDATSGATIARTFFELLSLPPVERVPDLEERLAMVVSSADLNPTLQLSKARQRWRRAAAKVIYSIRQSKLQGGHTVPRKVTSSTYRTPAIRRSTGCEFTSAESALILENCRRHKVTLGAAIPVIYKWPSHVSCIVATSVARSPRKNGKRGDGSPCIFMDH
ncbi:hypothetical protein A0H81_04304 [Grifola frondosa]|uniref:Condensation domain-containing protein n=1 Tax=Grifola frondosa TaxID=5627 RepID=A0A1C7MHH0_GRIFR|nr:hypothetical protein A0H81_04304 [Grifola frondosa]